MLIAFHICSWYGIYNVREGVSNAISRIFLIIPETENQWDCLRQSSTCKNVILEMVSVKKDPPQTQTHEHGNLRMISVINPLFCILLWNLKNKMFFGECAYSWTAGKKLFCGYIKPKPPVSYRLLTNLTLFCSIQWTGNSSVREQKSRAVSFILISVFSS